MLRTSNEKFSHGMTINNNDIKAVYDQTPKPQNPKTPWSDLVLNLNMWLTSKCTKIDNKFFMLLRTNNPIAIWMFTWVVCARKMRHYLNWQCQVDVHSVKFMRSGVSRGVIAHFAAAHSPHSRHLRPSARSLVKLNHQFVGSETTC